MLHTFWEVVFHQPFYNALVFLVAHMPGRDVGLAVIALTILVKLILLPLNQKAIESQIKLKALEPEINKIKEDFPNKTEQSKKTFELYKKYNINPFSGCLVMLVQLPVIFALYGVFLKGFTLNETALYHFMKFPIDASTKFLGLIDITTPNKVLAIIAGVSQYFQISISQNNQKIKTLDNHGREIVPNVSKDSKKMDFQAELTKSMGTQMKYFLPVIIVVVAWKVSAAVALYWVTSNAVGIVQEIIIAKKMRKGGLKNLAKV